MSPSTPEATDPLQGYPVTVEIDVAWGDMDAFAHVNNTVYFRWFETARIAYLEGIGVRGDGVPRGVGPILASTHCRFRRPVVHPDRIRAGARVVEIGEDRLHFEHRVVSLSAGRLVAEGGAVVVTYDYSRGEKAPVPGEMRAAIEGLEAGTGR